MKDYFAFMDRLCLQYATDSLSQFNEYHLVHANPWLLHRLYQTDYYLLKEKGIINLKQSELTVLWPDDLFRIPDSSEIREIDDQLMHTRIDVNLPEYSLRILQYDSVLYQIPIRIGQDRSRYLAMAGREVNLRTHTGVGKIVRINKKPAFINPADNRMYHQTTRDDGVRTDLPTIPWLEPMINGLLYGQLIHPTTNPGTLGRKSSNGCIGTRECDAWLIYYYAPLGTAIEIRNDRRIIDAEGNTTLLPEVYSKYPGLSQKTPQLPVEMILELGR